MMGKHGAGCMRIYSLSITGRNIDSEKNEILHDMVMALVPGFHDVICEYAEEPDKLDTFINLVSKSNICAYYLSHCYQQLNKWSNEARHEDTGSIKHAALEYIPWNPDDTSFQPPITRTQGKSVHGFNHAATARLLCPFRDLVAFDQNPQ
jgi:hypothetical protein